MNIINKQQINNFTNSNIVSYLSDEQLKKIDSIQLNNLVSFFLEEFQSNQHVINSIRTIKENLFIKLHRAPLLPELEKKISQLLFKTLVLFNDQPTTLNSNLKNKENEKNKKLAPYKKLFSMHTLAFNPKGKISHALLIDRSKRCIGSFNEVFAAFSITTGQRVVCRSLKFCHIKNPVVISQWRAENALHHYFQAHIKGIIKLHQVIDMPSEIVLSKFGTILPLCKGTLSNFIDNQKLTEYQLIDLAIQLTKVLSQLHCLKHEDGKGKGFIHADLKPDNILYALKDKRIKIKLADFGFSQKIGENTRLGGTLTYQPPETFKIGNIKGVENDAWSLGLILLQLKYGNLHASVDLTVLQQKIKDTIEYLYLSYGGCLDLIYTKANYKQILANYLEKHKKITLVEAEQVIIRWTELGLLNANHYLNALPLRYSIENQFRWHLGQKENFSASSCLSLPTEQAVNYYQSLARQKDQELACDQLIRWHEENNFVNLLAPYNPSALSASLKKFIKDQIHNFYVEHYLKHLYASEFDSIINTINSNKQNPIDSIILGLLNIDPVIRLTPVQAYNYLVKLYKNI